MYSKTLISYVVFQKCIDFSQSLIRSNFHLNSTSLINSESNISFRSNKKVLLKSPRSYGNISLFLSVNCSCAYHLLLHWKPVWFLALISALSLVRPLCSPPSLVLGIGTSVMERDGNCRVLIHQLSPASNSCHISGFAALLPSVLMSLKQDGKRNGAGTAVLTGTRTKSPKYCQ